MSEVTETSGLHDSKYHPRYGGDPEQVAVLRKVLDEGGTFAGFLVCDRDPRHDPPKPQQYYLSPFALREIVYNLSREYGQTS